MISYSQAVLVYVILALSYAYLKSYRRWTSLRHLPKPDGASWVWGNEKQVYDESAGVTFSTWMKELGRAYRIKGGLWKGDILVLCDPEGIAHILQRRIYDYPHSEVSRPRIARMLEKSLGWVEGESEHKRMRQLVAPSLSIEAIKTGSPQVFDAAFELVEQLDREVGTNGGTLDVNILDWTSRATFVLPKSSRAWNSRTYSLNVIGRFGFGHDFQSGYSQAAKRILGAWRTMATKAMSEDGFYALMLLRRFMFMNYLPLPALRAQGDVRLTIHDGVAQELIRRRGEVGSSARGHDLLSRLLIALRDHKITSEEMLDHISMFIIAGEETTSQTLGYAIWELARHPEQQSELRVEVATFNALTYDDVQSRMPYLDAVCRETLRLHAAFPYMERISAKEDIIPLHHPIVDDQGKFRHEIHIQPGQTVIIPILSIHHDGEVWDDALAFKPERWLRGLPQSDCLPRGWSNTLAFSDGPRNCVGYRLALFQFKVILATLIRSFSFLDTGVRIKNKVASSMQPYAVGQSHLGPHLPVRIMAL